MNREQFRKFQQSGNTNHLKDVVVVDESMCDPTFARTGRQLIFDPLNVEYRMKYPQGVPLNPDNPYKFKEYDKIFPDTFKAIREANSDLVNAESNLKKIGKKVDKE